MAPTTAAGYFGVSLRGLLTPGQSAHVRSGGQTPTPPHGASPPRHKRSTGPPLRAVTAANDR
jgi:hypothetical protein